MPPRSKVYAKSFRVFDGGLNIRDAPQALEDNEFPLGFNITLDERGGISARPGTYELNTASPLGAAPHALYYSTVADRLLGFLSNVGGVGRLIFSTDGGVTWGTNTLVSFTLNGRADIVDFNQYVVLVHSIDGVYTYDAPMTTSVHAVGGANNMEAVKGSAITVWQNKVWVAEVNSNRIYWSNRGDQTRWTIADDFNNIREGGDEAVTAIGAGQGMDVTAQPGLLVCKKRSVHRVNSSTDGNYTTLDQGEAGAASPEALASVGGFICMVNDRGIWVTDGVSRPVKASDKLAPLFTKDGLDSSTMLNWTAAPYFDRVLFNLTRAGDTFNKLQLEFHPGQGWIVAHKGRHLGSMVAYSKNTQKVFAFGSDTNSLNPMANLFCYEVGRGGTDDGTAIACSWRSKWLELAAGGNSRLRKARVWGRGAFDFFTWIDFTTAADPSAGTALTFDATRSQDDEELPLDHVGRFYQFGLSKSVTTSGSGTSILGDGTQPEVGAFGMFGIRLDYVPLGLS